MAMKTLLTNTLKALFLGAFILVSCTNNDADKDPIDDSGDGSGDESGLIDGGPLDDVELVTTVEGLREFTLTSSVRQLTFVTTIVTNENTSLWTSPTLVQAFDDVMVFDGDDVDVEIGGTAVAEAVVSVDDNELTVSFGHGAYEQVRRTCI